MAIKEIKIFPEDVLREVAAPVTDPTSDAIKQLVQDMADTMYDAPGVGLAAPQIGVSLRVVVTDTDWRSERYEGVGGKHGDSRNLKAWINPEFVWKSDHTETCEEGCLSVPEIYEDVTRPNAVRLRWQDLEGKTHEQDFTGFEAVALQHEFDHLDGTLFFDHLSPLKRKLIIKKLIKRKKLAE